MMPSTVGCAMVCDEDAVKEVLVDGWQRVDTDGVLTGQRQFLIAVVQQAAM